MILDFGLDSSNDENILTSFPDEYTLHYTVRVIIKIIKLKEYFDYSHRYVFD